MRLPLGLFSACPLGIALVVSSPASADAPAIKEVAKGGLVAPQFSPDGTRLLITGERMHGIGEINIATGDVRWHLDEARVGVHSHYLADGSIGFRAKRAGRIRDLKLTRGGGITASKEAKATVYAHGDTIYLRSADGVSKVGTGDRFFAPILSPDGSKIVFTGLSTGVHIYDLATRRQTRLGAGTSPSWAPDSKRIAFERTEDDGHTIVGSDIWIWTEGRGIRALTQTDARIERHPSWSPDGSKIAFDDENGSIFIADMSGIR